MDIEAPEIRICQSCKNPITLNLFRLNSKQCRYCENGIKIPKRLLIYDNNQDSISSTPKIQKEVRKESLDDVNDNEYW